MAQHSDRSSWDPPTPAWGLETPPYLIGVLHFGALAVGAILSVAFFCHHYQGGWKGVPAGPRVPRASLIP